MAGPLDELVARIHRRIEEFATEHGVEAMVEVELTDGSLHRLKSISAEPGYGFVTLCPHADPESEPQVLIVPLGAIRQLTIAAAEPERRIGFSLPSEPE
jgi:hypothetical protein